MTNIGKIYMLSFGASARLHRCTLLTCIRWFKCTGHQTSICFWLQRSVTKGAHFLKMKLLSTLFSSTICNFLCICTALLFTSSNALMTYCKEFPNLTTNLKSQFSNSINENKYSTMKLQDKVCMKNICFL